MAAGSACAALAIAVFAALERLTEGSVWLSAAIAGVVLLASLVPAMQLVYRPLLRRIHALIDSADSLRDADFSFTIADKTDDELGDLVRAYNEMVGTLRLERQNLHQRELMLDTVLQASPLALVLCNDNDHVIYANATARELFSNGQRFAGKKFRQDVACGAPAPLREAIEAGHDAMVSVEAGGDLERFHLSCSHFTLNSRSHTLYLLKRLTHELNRQEVATWKKVIRLIGHELNNSLAPISSLAHSGGVLLDREAYPRLREVLGTIEERSQHLKTFIEGYSRFAKLPTPQLEEIAWDRFLARIATLQPFRYAPIGAEASVFADRHQLEQVIINLCKNAAESGSDPGEIEVILKHERDGWRLQVEDRGKGMSDEALASALLPFYSTKKSGSGLGLSLCREIVDAHGGRISLHNRTGGGLSVRVWLPAVAPAVPVQVAS